MQKIAIIIVSILFIVAIGLLVTGKVSLGDDSKVNYDDCVKNCQEKYPRAKEGWSNDSNLQRQTQCIRIECEYNK